MILKKRGVNADYNNLRYFLLLFIPPVDKIAFSKAKTKSIHLNLL